MSINVYLKNDIRNLPGFSINRHPDNSGDKVQIDGVGLCSDKGRIYLIISDFNSVIPEKLRDFVDEVTQYEWIPRTGLREAGIYRHESAECELVPKDSGGKRDNPQYWLQMKAKKLEDLRELLHRIKIGTIRPEESYEGSQNGLSRKELEEIALERDRLLDLLNSKQSDIEQLNLRLRQLARSMKNGSLLPLIFRKTVVKQIDEIFDEVK